MKRYDFMIKIKWECKNSREDCRSISIYAETPKEAMIEANRIAKRFRLFGDDPTLPDDFYTKGFERPVHNKQWEESYGKQILPYRVDVELCF